MQWIGITPTINVGDMVRQRGTERPRMRVYAIQDDTVWCSWWVAENRRLEKKFPAGELEAWEDS